MKGSGIARAGKRLPVRDELVGGCNRIRLDSGYKPELLFRLQSTTNFKSMSRTFWEVA